ncbi:hypothetical protein CUMW_188730 [Citrus unshiu]|nr:hypothetical protein CUMW_188730 [Citrus unshiu]
MLSFGQSAGLLGYHEYRPERILKVADLIVPFWSWPCVVLWERCDKDGLPTARILVAAPGMGGAGAESDCVGPVAVFEPWGKGETELIPHPSLRIP